MAADRGEGDPGEPPFELDIRRDFVEVSLDLSRLIQAFGPDLLLQVPRQFRGRRNALTARELLSAHAAALPGFVAELETADRLRRIAFRVDGALEGRFLATMRRLVREVLIEPRGIGAIPASPRR